MSITVSGGGLPANVVEIGNEVTQGIVDGLNNASPAPSSSNPFATQSNLVSFATTAQAQTGLSTTTAISPATSLDSKFVAGGRFSGYLTWSSNTSGTGATAGTGFIKSIQAPTSAIGHAISHISAQNTQRGQIYNCGIDFSKFVEFGGRFCRLTSGTIDTNSIFRYILGRSQPLTTAGDLAGAGVGIRVVGNSGVVELQVHNGTTLYNISTSFTPVYNISFDVVITVNNGVATLFINGASAATSSNAPTTLLGANFGTLHAECQNTAVLTNSAYQINCSDQFLHISPV